jgi:hypothetical protein
MNERARPIWRETAEVIGVLGVVGSLIFVAFEIQQNTNAVRSATIQAMSQQSYDSLALFVENSDLRAAWLAEQEGTVTEEQFLVMRSYWGAQVRTQQNRFLQIKLGILDEETALQIRDAGESGTGGRARSFRQHWDAMKFNYPADFVDYMDNVVLAPDRAMRE